MAEACSRVTASFDLDDALQAVVDEARSICGARLGVLVTFHDTGDISELITSGFSPEELQRLWAPQKGWGLLKDLNRIQHPLRVSDLSGYAKSTGLFEDDLPAKSFMATPMRHQGERIGNIFLCGKQGSEEFSLEDEEILGMFAGHAAVAISNARMYRQEQRAKAELEALIESSPLGILVFDAKTGNLVSVNEETRRIVGGLLGRGHSPEELLDTLTFRRTDGREFQLDALPLTRVLGSGETVRAEEVVISHPDGKSVTALVNARPIYADDGEITSVVATLQDLTPFAEVEKQRAEFLGMVSLGLRTPLAAIKGSTATVLGAPSPPERAEILQLLSIIDEQVDHMRDLTNDLLDVSRIDLGNLSITSEANSVADIVDEAARAYQSSNSSNPLEVDLRHELPYVSADRNRVVQVLIRLFTNASKLSVEQSAIRVRASQMDSHVAVTVANEGEGISDERLPHLFSKFYRIYDWDSGEQFGDTGLSLTICKGIVEAHGGRIWADCDGPGQGARFTFTIPIVAVEEAERKKGSQAPQLSARFNLRSNERRTILAIDDHPPTLRYLRNAISEAGYTSVITSDPKEADRLVEEEKPDVVLLDAMLPRADGFALMKRLAETTIAPVIFLSERDSDQDIAKAFEMGAADYIVKPFSPNEMVARIRVALRNRSTRDQDMPGNTCLLQDLRINYAERSVTVNSLPVKLTATEFDLLFELSTNPGRVLTHDHLLQRVWGPTYLGDLQLLRTYVKYLRQKLGDDASNPKYIFTEPRVGYRMAKANS